MKKMTKSRFSLKRKMSVAMFCRALKDERNLGKESAAKVARVLGTDTHIWRNSGFLLARSAAWSAYLDKCNGGGK